MASSLNEALALAVVGSLLLATGCGSRDGENLNHGVGAGRGETVSPAAEGSTHTAQVDVSTTPALFPSFDPAVTDYVARCAGDPVQVGVAVPNSKNVRVSVDGQTPHNSSFSASVAVASGQSFSIVVQSPAAATGSHSGNSGQPAASTSTTYHVRCLPLDFPQFAVERPGPPQTEGFVATPWIKTDFTGGPPGTSQQYVSVFDNVGVPLWWTKSSGFSTPMDGKLLPNGNIAWLHATPSPGEEHRLDGTLVRTLSTVGGPPDQHEVQLLPNGNYLLVRYFTRTEVDLSSCGGPASTSLLDNEVQEVTPGGALVWSWDAMDHIPVAETSWSFNCAGDAGAHDVFHLNSVEPAGDDVVISFRHLSAVYKVSRATGEIVWKVGGSPRPESLVVVGDPIVAGPVFSGQHDARVLPDGTLTAHDNRLFQTQPPRAVRFRLDEAARTATFVEAVSDPDVTGAFCCGSARKLSGGDWLVDWGSNDGVTELAPDGTRVFRIRFTQSLFSYRANPIVGLDRPSFRTAMDSIYPRP